MNDGNQGDAGRAARYSKMIGALVTARALAGQEVAPAVVERLRSQVVEKIRERAVVIGRARRANGRDSAQRHGLVLKQRLRLSRERLGSSRVVAGKVAEHLRAALLTHSKQALDPTEFMRIHVETAEPIKPNVLEENVCQTLGFVSVAEMTKAGVTIETPLRTDESGRAFGISLAVRSSALSVLPSQITALLQAGI